VVKAAGAYS